MSKRGSWLAGSAIDINFAENLPMGGQGSEQNEEICTIQNKMNGSLDVYLYSHRYVHIYFL